MGKSILKVLLIILVVSQTALSQELPSYLQPDNKQIPTKYNNTKAKKHFANKTQNATIRFRPYDVLNYDVYLDWYNILKATGVDSLDRLYSGVQKMRMKIDSNNISSIKLDAVDLLIKSIAVNSKSINNPNQPVDGILSIPITPPANKGDIINLEIGYEYVRFDSVDQQIGMFVYPKGKPSDLNIKGDTLRIEERLAYTMSEPEMARYWMPCNDSPSDKAVASIAVRVPDGYSVCSNGLQTKVETSGDSKTYFWADTTQIATYLMMATASKFFMFQDFYHRRNNPNDSIPIQYWVWEKDYLDTNMDGTTYNAKYSLRNTKYMAEVFSNFFIEYPYQKYGMVAVQEFDYGGMEHQTLTTIHRNWLMPKNRWGQNADWGHQNGIAHELAHQWLGDLITCATWKDLWINEGGATWSEALWNYAASGFNRKAYTSKMMDSRWGYLFAGQWQGITEQCPIYDQPMSNLFNYATTYCKSGWVYHMLNVMVGDTVFMPALRNLMKTYSFRSLTTEEFKAFFKSQIPNPTIDFDTFFDQWVYKAGHPIYSLETTAHDRANGEFEIQVYVTQTQVAKQYTFPEVFKVPLILRFHGKDTVITRKVINNLRSQQFGFTLPFLPDSVGIDSTNILCELASTITSITETEISANNSSVYPNPIYTGADGSFEYTMSEDGGLKIEIVNSLGIRVDNLYQGILSKGNYKFTFKTQNLPDGVYYLNSTSKKGSITNKFSIIR